MTVKSRLKRTLWRRLYLFFHVALPVCFVSCWCVASAAASSAPDTGHNQAAGALADTQSAIQEIKKSARITDSGPDSYKRAARRAVNALVGENDPEYSAAAGNPGDANGAIGHLNTLLHRPHSHPWNASVHGAWVNAMVAVSELGQALKEDDLDAFETDMTEALQSLEMVLGQASDTGSLGGLQGAMASTVLGVPARGEQVSGCVPPPGAPAYGVHKGYLLYVALPLKNTSVTLPNQAGVGQEIEIKKNYVIIRTPAYARFDQLCSDSKAAANVASNQPTKAAAATSDPHAKLFTAPQAERGKAIFLHDCSSCHGKDMQGGSAPPNGGTTFLKKAKALGWSVSDMRYLVVNTMPLNNPASLSAQQYADVLAYLLAASCYPAGAQPFPTKDTPALKKTKLEPLSGVKADHPGKGTCDVH